jgi:hypothetical protein
VLDFCIAGSELLALRKNQGLQRFGIELIEIRKCGGIHGREPSAVLLQRDENTS